ncbi:MAG: hypothetical protein F6J87_06130 [Spirulina sp. SIO3F2]|nr:hypothetical protein [Spirulina sp. SIO3F2]
MPEANIKHIFTKSAIALLAIASSVFLFIHILEYRSETESQKLAKLVEASLQEKKWEYADELTQKFMLRSLNWPLDFEEFGIWDILKLDCNRIKKIDTAWQESSDGKFGFSVQQKIWKSVELSLPNENRQYFERFELLYQKLGWNSESDTIEFYDISEKSISPDIPEGYFPSKQWTLSYLDGNPRPDALLILFKKLDSCHSS